MGLGFPSSTAFLVAEILVGGLHLGGFSMILRAYIFHLRARNLSPATVKATGEYLRPFIALHDPLTTTRRKNVHHIIFASLIGVRLRPLIFL